MNQESGIRNQELTKALGAMCFVVVIALVLLFTQTTAVYAESCACPDPASGTTVVQCAECKGLAKYCLKKECVAGTAFVGYDVLVEFAAPTSTTTFSGFLCNVIGFINKDILPP